MAATGSKATGGILFSLGSAWRRQSMTTLLRGSSASVPSYAKASNVSESPWPGHALCYTVKKEQPEPLPTKVKGEVPKWINGSLLRNGGGKFEVGKDSYNHMFDGLSLLTRYNIRNGKVSYQTNFQRSDAYIKAMEQNRIVMSEFGTTAHPDPCLGIFGRFMARFKPSQFTDNCNVNWMAIGDECYVMTETKEIRKIDPVTLETLDKVDLSKRMAVHTATAHPHITNDGIMYNMGSHYDRKSHYNIIKALPPDPGVMADPMSKASVLCSIPASDSFPSYYHSFGMTDNYIVFLEQPLVLNLLKLRFIRIFKSGFSTTMKYQKTRPARFHLIKRDTGELLSQRFLADPLFCFHHINAYEEGGHVVVDLCCYTDESVIQSVAVAEMRNGMRTNAPLIKSEGKRFILPVDREKTPGMNLNALDYSKATAVLNDDGSIHCTPEVISDKYVELPRINYEKHNGKPYQYFYGTSGDLWQLLKSDTRTATSQVWMEEGALPSEPVFIGAPGSTSEDDGVVVSAVVSVQEGKPSFLLVLDARDMKEVARAEIDAEVIFGIHGMYLAN
ncbi:beta,beta-carotene 9',10'-oxygenase-like [Acanthaster planci]|uniref:Beta,beta-carotene 9',10'-oxygenase-like n=1 Tax=Acanthaster planci TaxID=133434 RepID=A0A8B7ZIP2_ACAPL|nr:beta,beta-carotene 9',10'-oxygenase-like [Acanthaster planci]XP_022104746.1 beta,beta-carotene 9',10'-oxygenase-like [Acanthaster planci]